MLILGISEQMRYRRFIQRSPLDLNADNYYNGDIEQQADTSKACKKISACGVLLLDRHCVIWEL